MELYVGDYQLIVIDDVSASPSHVKVLSVHKHSQLIGNVSLAKFSINNLEKLQQYFHVSKHKEAPVKFCLPTRCCKNKQKFTSEWQNKHRNAMIVNAINKHTSETKFKQSSIHTGKVWSPIARFVWWLYCCWWRTWRIARIKRRRLRSFLPQISKNNGCRSWISHLRQLSYLLRHLLLLCGTLGIHTIHSIGLRLPHKRLFSNWTQIIWQNITLTRNSKQKLTFN